MLQLSAALTQQIYSSLISAEQAIQGTISSDQRTGQPTFYALAADEIRRLDQATSWNRIVVLH